MEPSLPPGYREIDAITLTPGRAILLQAISLFLAFVVLAALLAVAGSGSFTVDPARAWLLLVLLAGAIGVLILHEAIHGLVLALAGLRPRFSVAIIHGMPVLSTSATRPYGRNTALICLLVPLVLIDGLLLVIWAVFPPLFAWVILPLVMNTSGAVGDLWMAASLARYGPALLVRDTPDGLLVYGRPGERRLSEAVEISALVLGAKVFFIVLLGLGLLAALAPVLLGLFGTTLYEMDPGGAFLSYHEGPDGIEYAFSPLAPFAAALVAALLAVAVGRSRSGGV